MERHESTAFDRHRLLLPSRTFADYRRSGEMMHILTDQLGDFGLYDIPGLMFSVVIAALLAWILSFALKNVEDRWRAMLLASLVAIGVSVCRASLPLAMSLVAVALLVRAYIPSRPENNGYLMVAAGLLGFLCGARSSMIALLVLLPLFILLRAANSKSSSS